MHDINCELLDNLNNEIVVLNSEGTIIYENTKWIHYVNTHNGENNSYIEVDYLEHCRDTESGNEICTGLTEILNQERDKFISDYPCHYEDVKEWYRLIATSKIIDDELYVIIEHQDISELKYSELRVKELNSFISSHLAYMRHEIKNKSAIIKGNADLVAEKISESHPEIIDEHLSPIESASSIISSLVEIKPDNPLFKQPKKVKTDLRTLCHSVWTEIPNKQDSKLYINGDLTLHVDKFQFERLIENVFLNSLQHSTDDITITVEVLENEHGFRIINTGPKFNEDVFEQSIDTTNEQDIGTNIIQKIVSNHDWSLTVNSNEEINELIFHL